MRAAAKPIRALSVQCFTMANARAIASTKLPPRLKQAKAKLKKSNEAAREFEAELEEAFEQAREQGHKPGTAA
jgi:flagellar biosynthesis/type III secretory pathway protein FliH